MDSINRHEQLLRIFNLIDILGAARVPLTVKELKERLRERGVIDEMSDKNLRRDILFLEKFGYALEETKKPATKGPARTAWTLRHGIGRGALPPPSVALPELLSLAVAREFLAPLAGTIYWRGFSQLFAKLEAIATPALLDYIERHKDGLVVHPRPAGAKYDPALLGTINRAILGHLVLTIRYRRLGDDAFSSQTIEPEALVVYDASLYIAGYPSDGDGGVRFYKLDRIERVQAGPKSFTPRSEPLASLLADSITLFRSPTPPRRFRIRVDATRARWARERPFHPGQKVVDEPDGGIVLVIERGWEEEIVPQLLSLGAHAELLEPKDVRGRIAAEAARMAARHERRSRPASRNGRPALSGTGGGRNGSGSRSAASR